VIEGLQSEVRNLTYQLEATLKLLPDDRDDVSPEQQQQQQQVNEQQEALISRMMSELGQAQALESAATQRAQDLEVERDEMIKSLAQYVQQVRSWIMVLGATILDWHCCSSLEPGNWSH
jgi:predicted transcriptional regulator